MNMRAGHKKLTNARDSRVCVCMCVCVWGEGGRRRGNFMIGAAFNMNGGGGGHIKTEICHQQ